MGNAHSAGRHGGMPVPVTYPVSTSAADCLHGLGIEGAASSFCTAACPGEARACCRASAPWLDDVATLSREAR